MIAIEEFCQALNLEPLTQTTRKEMDINVTDLNRPGMQFCGFYEFFAAERPQVIGKVEMTYLESIEPTVREKVLRRYMSYDLPCIVCCWGMTPPKELLQIATERDIPVFMSRVKTTKFTLQAIMYLNRVLAPHVTWSSGAISWRRTTWWTSAGCPTTGWWAKRPKWCVTSWRFAASASSISAPCTALAPSFCPSPSTWSSTWKSGTPPRSTTGWA